MHRGEADVLSESVKKAVLRNEREAIEFHLMTTRAPTGAAVYGYFNANQVGYQVNGVR